MSTPSERSLTYTLSPQVLKPRALALPAPDDGGRLPQLALPATILPLPPRISDMLQVNANAKAYCLLRNPHWAPLI